MKFDVSAAFTAGTVQTIQDYAITQAINAGTVVAGDPNDELYRQLGTLLVSLFSGVLVPLLLDWFRGRKSKRKNTSTP